MVGVGARVVVTACAMILRISSSDKVLPYDSRTFVWALRLGCRLIKG